MGRRLRAFLSSTMRDLANERFAVIERLASLNVEVVNAEGWQASRESAWDRIQSEIESSDIFVLVLGDRYGWIPQHGPGAGSGRSVTHLEYDEAGRLGLPVLPFLKRLSYDGPRGTDDAKKRDAFRESVGSWAEGRFTSEFDLAADLANNVCRAVVHILTDKFLGRAIAARTARVGEHASHLPLSVSHGHTPANEVQLPRALVAAVRKRNAVLFAGAGVSLAAGFPSEAAFVEHLRSFMADKSGKAVVGAAGTSFPAIASDVEALLSRDDLTNEMARLFNPPQGVSPTFTHHAAVTLFDTIVTTNFDTLFEEAALATGERWQIIDHDLPPAPDFKRIIKLHGSWNAPESLVVTETDIALLETSKPHLWSALQAMFAEHTVVATGSSLRNPSIVRLFRTIRDLQPSFAVLPGHNAANDARLSSWNFDVVRMDADTFFRKLIADAAFPTEEQP